MKTKLNGLLTLLFALVVQISFAQTKTVTGTVTDGSGVPLPGVNILVEGTSTGTQSDFDGNYSIEAEQGTNLVFSYVGFSNQTVAVTSTNTYDVQMEAGEALDAVVVTALGITREKKTLGYATQEVSGSEVSDVPTTNFMNSLSGKVSGLSIKSSGTIGGSTNVVIRGNSSLTGNNQALFVVDGTPISNGNTNTTGQQTGRGGFDYGNAASDINPNDIASINVLKGAAATALYGARAANGVVIIETKKGQKGKGIGISINSSLTTTHVNKNTLPNYQKEYGAGYGAFYGPNGDAFFNQADVTGDGVPNLVTPFTEDASFGARFDPNLLIYQWNSIYPQLDTYRQASPWIAGRNDANTIWNTGYTAINSVALNGGSDTNSFRISFTNLDQEGNLPNSQIKRNTLTFSGQQDLTDDLSATANITYIKTDGTGRYGTGYDTQNPMQAFRQFFQTNVDLQDQQNAFLATGDNITWNPNSAFDLSPIYTDNFYWNRANNFETDTRNRYYGNINLNYQINDIFSILGRFTFDTYDEVQEERINIGSASVSSYSRYNNRQAEYNGDLILNVNTDLTEELNLDGNLGFNLRRNTRSSIRAQTNGGLNAPGFYALSNSANPLNPPDEYDNTRMLDGVYARASLGYLNTYYLEGTIRRDRSSTLPIENNTFWYPSISGNIILSQLISADWLGFAKVRANYAEVGSDTDPYRVFNTYTISAPFNGAGVASNNSQLNNLALKPERQKSYEFGLEASFLKNLISLDVSYYRNKTEDQITPVPVSNATGFDTKLLNAGTIENKGVEVLLTLNPISTDNFDWTIAANFAKNKSEVLELTDGIDNLRLNPIGLQSGVSINAAPGEPYGSIRGTDYTYDDQGRKIVKANGYYLLNTSSSNIIGNIQPDWTGGVKNTLRYKNLALSFLVDVQQGGDIYSLDTWYGYGVGLYDVTAGLNELGNPLRDPVTTGANSGGILLPGVTENGQPNTVRAPFNSSANPLGYGGNAQRGHVYDASYVKLREASLTYNFGSSIIDNTPLTSASFSIIGRNLWIIHKNIPYSDPEAGLSSGNIQGYQSGAYPAFKEVGASLKLNF